MPLEFPPAFDVNYYRRSYPELSIYSDEVVREHYRRFAEEQGRTCCAYDLSEMMRALLNDAVNKLPVKLLEIGPYDNPTVSVPKNGKGTVKYFDLFEARALAQLAEKNKRPFHRTPEKIDYVSPNGDLSIIDEQFDIVFSQHSIEHQMNLVAHLQAVERLLNDGGLFVLIIPDKRYCFDHYRRETSITDVLDRYFGNVKFRPFGDYIGFETMSTHNRAADHWQGNHGDISNNLTREKLDELSRNYNEARAADRYIDVHSLFFTPRSFAEIINALNRLQLTRFEVHRLCHTVWGRFEFSVVLRKV